MVELLNHCLSLGDAPKLQEGGGASSSLHQANIFGQGEASPAHSPPDNVGGHRIVQVADVKDVGRGIFNILAFLNINNFFYDYWW